MSNFMAKTPIYNHSRKKRKESFCPGTWDDAIAGLASCYHAPNSQASLLASIEQKICDAWTYKRPETQFAVSGQYVDVGRYLSGEPECMGQTVMVDGTGRQGVEIWVNGAASVGVHQSNIQRRGAAINAFLEGLRQRNIPFALKLAIGSHYNDEDYWFWFDINSEDGISADLLAFCLIHPAYLRRIFFAWLERKTGESDCGSYGKPLNFSNVPADVIAFDDNFRDWENYDTDEKAADQVLARIKKLR
jgi:hypothetical protein